MKCWFLSLELDGSFFNHTGWADSAIQLLIDVIEQYKNERIHLLFATEISGDDQEEYKKTRDKYFEP